jgi:hypothetical protein
MRQQLRAILSVPFQAWLVRVIGSKLPVTGFTAHPEPAAMSYTHPPISNSPASKRERTLGCVFKFSYLFTA